MRLFIFGDSIAQGFYDNIGGWVTRLAREYHMASLASINDANEVWYEVFNLGVSGDTAAGLLKRLESEVQARRLYDSDGPDIIILSVGINDSCLRDNRASMDVYKFQENYEKAIEIAKDLEARVICLGLTAVDESKTDPWIGSSSGKQWKNNRINLFEDAIKQSTTRLDVEFVGLHDAFLSKLRSGEAILADGLHPNDAGHAWIYAEVYKALSS